MQALAYLFSLSCSSGGEWQSGLKKWWCLSFNEIILSFLFLSYLSCFVTFLTLHRLLRFHFKFAEPSELSIRCCNPWAKSYLFKTLPSNAPAKELGKTEKGNSWTRKGKLAKEELFPRRVYGTPERQVVKIVSEMPLIFFSSCDIQVCNNKSWSKWVIFCKNLYSQG